MWTRAWASFLLFADAELDRLRSFGHTAWPGYPVVNPTALGSRSAMSLAAAWAAVTRLGEQGYAALTARVVDATRTVRTAVEGTTGLAVLGDPIGPLLAVAVDPEAPQEDQVDPHAWAGAVQRRGFVLQGQPAFAQGDGSVIPRSTHLTLTPASASVIDELCIALAAGADDVRGRAPLDLSGAAEPDPAALAAQARQTGELDLAPVLALIEALPRERSARLLVDFLAEFTAPPAASRGATQNRSKGSSSGGSSGRP